MHVLSTPVVVLLQFAVAAAVVVSTVLRSRFRQSRPFQSTGGAGSFLSLSPRCGIVEDEAVSTYGFVDDVAC
jgi:hypothetical protein